MAVKKRCLLTAFIAAFILSLLVGRACAWDGSAAEAFSGGDGSEENPYLISTAEELALMASLVNSPETNKEYAPLFYTLTEDIDISGSEWYPIGIGAMYDNSPEGIYPFLGVFDGGGHTVSGLTVSDSISFSWKRYEIETVKSGFITYYVYTEDGKPVYKTKTLADGTTEYVYKNVKSNLAVGLFGYNGGTIRNLDLEDVNIKTESAKTLSGGVCGISKKQTVTFGTWRDGEFVKSTTLYVADTGIVENCRTMSGLIEVITKDSSSGTPAGTFNIAGGVVGFAGSANIKNCFSAARIFGDGILGDSSLGGIVGRSGGSGTQYSKISLCTSVSEIDAVAGNIQFTLFYSGGIVGLAQSTNITNCTYKGKNIVSGGGNISLVAVGGIIGNSDVAATLTKSFADADLSATEKYGVSNCTVRVGLLVGTLSSSGGAASGGCFSYGRASVINGAAESGYTDVSAVLGKNDSYIYADVYRDRQTEFTVNGESVPSFSATECDIMLGGESFYDYFSDKIGSGDFYFTDSLFSDITFETDNYRMSSDGTLLSYGTLPVNEDGYLFLPYGTEAVAEDAFSQTEGIEDVERVIVPYSVNSESKALLEALFDGKTLAFSKTSQDTFLNKRESRLCGDYVAVNGSAVLYVGDGGSTSVSDSVITCTQSGVYDLGKPVCLEVDSGFTRAYLVYLCPEESLLHFTEDTDFAEFCEENSLAYEMLGDLDRNGSLSFYDLSLFSKFVESGTWDGCTCGYMFDVCRDGVFDKKDLWNYLKIFCE